MLFCGKGSTWGKMFLNEGGQTYPEGSRGLLWEWGKRLTLYFCTWERWLPDQLPVLQKGCGNACVTHFLCQRCRSRGWESLETLFLVSLPLVWRVSWVKSCFYAWTVSSFSKWCVWEVV